MLQKSNKLTRFWQELKRRKVIYVITVYASAAFVIIELINNLTEPLNLPSNLAIIVIIVLAVGFPLAIILSWIYDLTGEGFERTRPIEEVPEERVAKVNNTWKIATYISFAVIIGLVTFNIIGGRKGLKPGDIQSLVILPFENFTGDDQLDYVAEGLHASLIGDVGKISRLRVLGTTTSSVYKETDLTATEIATKHHVDALVEPTLTCYGEMVCIQVRVITLYPKEKLLWIEDYMEDKSEIPNRFNHITRKIADEMMIEITPEEDRLLSKSRTVDREAYDEYLKGYSLLGDMSAESLLKARDYLNSAIEKDPNWAPLYATLATVWLTLGGFGDEPLEIAYSKVYENTNKAIELDPDLAEAHYNKAWLAATAEWNWEKAEEEFLKALASNPNHAISRMNYSWLLYTLQRPEEAKNQAELAYKLDPLNPLMKCFYGAALLKGGDCASALAVLEDVVTSDPNNWYANFIYSGAAFQCGDLNRAFETIIHLQSFEEETINDIEKIFHEKGFNAAYEEIIGHLEIKFKKGDIFPMGMAVRYYMINQDDKAMYWIEKAFEVRDPNMWELTSQFPDFSRLYDNPRFIDIVEKMNLPLPED